VYIHAVRRSDITVVGAGLYGTSLACALAREGMAVRLLERDRPSGGDTGRSFGMVRRHYSNAVTVELARRGCELLAADRDANFVRTGYLLTVSPEQREACAGNVALGQSLGVDTRLLEPDQLAAVEPAISSEGIGAAAHEPDGGLVDASRYTLARFAEAVSLGVDVRIGAVENLHRIEIAVLRDAPVRAVVSDAVTNVVTRPVAGGGAWVVTYGGEVSYARRDECDGEPDPGYPQRVEQALRSRYPALAGAPYVGGWSGAYDVTPDWNPVVGWVRDGVFVVAGLSGHGLKLAPAIAESAAAVIAGREPRIDLGPLRFERFAEGDLLRLAYGPGARA
jgi:sarcosine oxidase subunit beta